MKVKSPRVILASGSPRRKEILEKMGVTFEIVTSDYAEDMTLPLPPDELVKHLAFGKAEGVAKKFPDALVIAADTIVVCEGKVLGKPHTAAIAEKMLSQLSGKNHEVITGMAIVYVAGEKFIQEAASTKVIFKTLTEIQIKEYVTTGEPLDKAGAYAVQGLGRAFIEKIEGDYWNLVGLPAGRLAEHLKVFGVSVKSL